MWLLLCNIVKFEDKNGKKRYLTKKEKNDKVTELLKLVDLADLSDKYPAQLSGGQTAKSSDCACFD